MEPQVAPKPADGIRITGTSSYIDVEIEGRTCRIAGELGQGYFLCYEETISEWMTPEVKPITDEEKKYIIEKLNEKSEKNPRMKIKIRKDKNIFKSLQEKIYQDMVAICSAFAQSRAEVVFLYICVDENNNLFAEQFYQIDGRICRIDDLRENHDDFDQIAQNTKNHLYGQLIDLASLYIEYNEIMPRAWKVRYSDGELKVTEKYVNPSKGETLGDFTLENWIEERNEVLQIGELSKPHSIEEYAEIIKARFVRRLKMSFTSITLKKIFFDYTEYETGEDPEMPEETWNKKSMMFCITIGSQELYVKAKEELVSEKGYTEEEAEAICDGSGIYEYRMINVIYYDFEEYEDMGLTSDMLIDSFRLGIEKIKAIDMGEYCLAADFCFDELRVID